MQLRTRFSAVLLILLCGCSQRSPGPAPDEKQELIKPESSPSQTSTKETPSQKANPQVIALKSGNQVKILSLVRQIFAKGKPALMIRYETGVQIDDVPALKSEAEEIWPQFKKDVEKEGYECVILSANEPPKGKTGGLFSFSNNRGYNFVFVKNESGEWKLQEKEIKNKVEKSK